MQRQPGHAARAQQRLAQDGHRQEADAASRLLEQGPQRAVLGQHHVDLEAAFDHRSDRLEQLAVRAVEVRGGVRHDDRRGPIRGHASAVPIDASSRVPPEARAPGTRGCRAAAARTPAGRPAARQAARTPRRARRSRWAARAPSAHRRRGRRRGHPSAASGGGGSPQVVDEQDGGEPHDRDHGERDWQGQREAAGWVQVAIQVHEDRQVHHRGSSRCRRHGRAIRRQESRAVSGGPAARRRSRGRSRRTAALPRRPSRPTTGSPAPRRRSRRGRRPRSASSPGSASDPRTRPAPPGGDRATGSRTASTPARPWPSSGGRRARAGRRGSSRRAPVDREVARVISSVIVLVLRGRATTSSAAGGDAARRCSCSP